MHNTWTGGQYSLFRILFGIYLITHFSYLSFWGAEVFSSQGMLADSSASPLIYLFPNILAVYDAPYFVTTFIASGALASILFALGYKDKFAALWIWYVLACLFGRNPLIANPSLPYVGWMLIAHLFIPPAPYGSLASHGRQNPDGGWFFPKNIYLAGWVILCVTYTYSGYTKLLSPSWVAGENINYVLNNPLARDYFLREFLLWLPPLMLKGLTWAVLYIELLFAPLALIKSLRMPLWSVMFLVQLGFAFLLNFPDLTLAMLLFHMFTFNPSWIRPDTHSHTNAVLYYDGNCGLCHRIVRFMLAEDRKALWKYTPLQSTSFEKALCAKTRDSLPDSIVIISKNKKPLTRSTAVIRLLRSLGGLWYIVGSILWFIPKPLRDFGYHFIGKQRYRFFSTPKNSCPIVSKELRNRFL